MIQNWKCPWCLSFPFFKQIYYTLFLHFSMEFLQLSTMGYNISIFPSWSRGSWTSWAFTTSLDPSTLKTRTSLEEMSSKGRKHILRRRTAEFLLFSWCKFNVLKNVDDWVWLYSFVCWWWFWLIHIFNINDLFVQIHCHHTNYYSPHCLHEGTAVGMCMGGCRCWFLVWHKQIWHQKHISITIAHHVSKFFTIEGDVFFYISHVQWREKGHNLGLTRSLLESLAVLYVCSYWCCHLLHPGSLLFPAYNLLWTAWTLSALAKTLVGLDTCVECVGSMHVDFLWGLTNYRTTRHLGMVHLGPVPAVRFTLPIDHTTDQLQLPIFDALLWNRSVPLLLHAGLFGETTYLQ